MNKEQKKLLNLYINIYFIYIFNTQIIAFKGKDRVQSYFVRFKYHQK